MPDYRFLLDIRVEGDDVDDASERFKDIMAQISELVPGINETQVVTHRMYEYEVIWAGEEI